MKQMSHPETELLEMQNPHEQEEMTRVLYEASRDGCVPTLRALIQKDPLVLHRVNSRTYFIDTPLHISASLGHLEFAKVLLAHKPNLALELDSFRSTALHIASAEGHIHIVKELLAAQEQACLVPDQEGRIPLHVAVIRGRLEVVTELVRAKPGSLKKLHKGKTALHLCVTYNHLEILTALVDSSVEICDELLSWGDLDGNTVLHLAIMFKQVETVRYLVSIPNIKEASKLKNKMGWRARDIVDGIPKDLNSLEIQIMLMSNGDKKETDIISEQEARTSDVVGEAVQGWKNSYYWRKMRRHLGKWFDQSVKGFEEMRGNLSTVATVITTMTFQSIINPPGGFIQQNISNPNTTTTSAPLDCLDKKRDFACPGQAVLASRDTETEHVFRIFMINNTVAFVASLGVTLLLISGLPLQNKVVMWVLSIGMCVTLTALARAYFAALFMITPDKVWDSTSVDETMDVVSYTWLALLALAAGYIILAFLIWILKHCIKFIKRIHKAVRTHSHSPVSVRRLP